MQLGGFVYPVNYAPQKNGGWLDKYADGGTMQEHQENYNNSSVSMGPGFVGMGNNTKGRNYSPAWGGQFAMGGNVPGSVGFTYARTQGIPSKGPHRNQTDVTDASAQNGAEMSFYQNGLDWTPKNISKNGSVIKDDRGQWTHPGEITEIQGDTMATHGYGDIPLWVEPDVGEPRLVQPNTGTHKFPGANKFKETPVSKKWLEKYK
jgi:hypothetical protein